MERNRVRDSCSLSDMKPAQKAAQTTADSTQMCCFGSTLVAISAEHVWGHVRLKLGGEPVRFRRREIKEL